MEPKIVEQAANPPGKCLASRDTEGPFIDTGCWAATGGNPYIYLSVRWVEEQAKKLLGMVPAAEVEERFVGLEQQVTKQAERLKALERFEEAAIEYEDARQGVLVVNASREAVSENA